MGGINGINQSIFFERYPEKNPKYKKSYQKKLSVKSRHFILIAGPIIGLLTGTAIGGFALLVRRFINLPDYISIFSFIN